MRGARGNLCAHSRLLGPVAVLILFAVSYFSAGHATRSVASEDGSITLSQGRLRLVWGFQ